MYINILHNPDVNHKKRWKEKVEIKRILTKSIGEKVGIYYITMEDEEQIVPSFASWEVTEF